MQDTKETARFLAGEHMKEDEGLRTVYWAPSEDEVYLVEVTTSAPDSGDVLPFRFTPDPPDVPFASTVILLSPQDWERVNRKELELPGSFSVDLQKILAR